MTKRLVTPQPERLQYIRYAFAQGSRVREVARLTTIDPGSCTSSRKLPTLQRDRRTDRRRHHAGTAA